MRLRKQFLGSGVALVVAALAGGAMSSHADETTDASRSNRELVRSAFDRWRAGTGGPFELLAEDARWTIAGSSPFSRTYAGKRQFMAEVIEPFNARMSRPLRPTVRGLHADGDTVVVLFDAESLAHDGKPYRNTYAWFMRLEGGRVKQVTAFFDTRLFDEMWARVRPAEKAPAGSGSAAD